MSDDERSVDELLGLFGDELTRGILLSTSETPLSAEELSDRFAVSRTTVYRRVKRLGRYDLVHEAVRTDRDGHHYRVFEAAVDGITFGIEDGKLAVTVSVAGDLADGFEGFMDGMEASVDRVTREAGDRADRTDGTDTWGNPHHG
ncbi:HTH domain-containing protein [Halorarum halobium]|uniref:HTH domain-containing protein n=1 Tax=Halorarum halobium TaxID=3075121 RepID=UPI0028AD3F86|nr:HTH domain-containing protein [Halobaculum sp. XH14]